MLVGVRWKFGFQRQKASARGSCRSGLISAPSLRLRKAQGDAGGDFKVRVELKVA